MGTEAPDVVIASSAVQSMENTWVILTLALRSWANQPEGDDRSETLMAAFDAMLVRTADAKAAVAKKIEQLQGGADA